VFILFKFYSAIVSPIAHGIVFGTETLKLHDTLISVLEMNECNGI